MPKKKARHFLLRRTYLLALLLGFLLVIAGGCMLYAFKQPPCANSISCTHDLSGKFDPHATVGIFMGKDVRVPSLDTALATAPVLGLSTGHKKHIYVDLTLQRLFAAEDGRIIYDFPISSGKWYPTPTGDFTVWYKVQYTRMTGGDPAIGTFYDLPNVPFTMFFYNDEIAKYRGFSIHGAYWHNNFGHPMSHGCVNMRVEDAKTLYYWADPAPVGLAMMVTQKDNPTPITIYGTTPSE